MQYIDWVTQPSAWIALVTLLVLEIVLGIDNIIFISILSNKLPPDKQAKARQIGLMLALISRILLLLSINWVKNATQPVLTLPFDFIPIEAREISWRDIILGGGGLFLIWKSVKEIHGKLEGEEGHGDVKGVATMAGVLTQIMILDVVFSLDSVITAVGMADQIGVMIFAVVLAVAFVLAGTDCPGAKQCHFNSITLVTPKRELRSSATITMTGTPCRFTKDSTRRQSFSASDVLSGQLG